MFTAGIVGDAFANGFYWILLGLDGLVYSAISKIYQVYVLLAGARILTNDAFTTIANKVYIVIGVAMLFVLAYAIIRSIINPDEMTKGKFSGPKLLKGVIVAVIGLALTPVIFNLAYQGQDIILKQNVLGKIFFSSDEDKDNNVHYDYEVPGAGKTEDGKASSGKVSGDVNTANSLSEAGNVVAIYIFQTFFYPSEINAVDETKIIGVRTDYFVDPGISTALVIGCAVGCAAAIVASIFTLGFGAIAAVATVAACAGGIAASAGNAVASSLSEKISLAEAIAYASGSGDFGIFKIFVKNVTSGDITYMFGVSTIVGLFVCYTFLSFSIDMAVRAAKLAYYQIIAPIPLIMQVLPNFEENFKKWRQDIIHTFLEVLIRLSIVYVIVYIVLHNNPLLEYTLRNKNNISGHEVYI